MIADDATMDLYELGPADRAELERTGALVLPVAWGGGTGRTATASKVVSRPSTAR